MRHHRQPSFQPVESIALHDVSDAAVREALARVASRLRMTIKDLGDETVIDWAVRRALAAVVEACDEEINETPPAQEMRSHG